MVLEAKDLGSSFKVHGPRALVQAALKISCWAFATPPASWMGGSSMWMGLDFRDGHIRSSTGRMATMSHALAASMAFRAMVSASPSSSASMATVVA